MVSSTAVLSLCMWLVLVNGAPINREPIRTKDGAFDMYAHAELTCATPVYHETVNGLDSCAAECLKRPECQSINWSPYIHICDLFTVTGKLTWNEAGKANCAGSGPEVSPAIGSAYLVRTGNQGYVPTTVANSYVPSTTTVNSYVPSTTVQNSYVPTTTGANSYVPSTTVNSYVPTTTVANTYVPSTTVAPTDSSTTINCNCDTSANTAATDQTPPTPSTSVPSSTQQQTETPSTQLTTPLTTQSATAPTTAFLTTLAQDETLSTSPGPSGTQCAADETVKYMKISGVQMVGANDASFVAASEQQCLDSCTGNQLPSGEIDYCRSINFNTQGSTCSVNKNSLAPSGSGSSSDSPSAIYYEKMCFKNSEVIGCADAFPLEHQHILIGYARAVVTAPTAQKCMEECINANLNFNFVCQSGMFYDPAAVATDNCLLNSETKSTKPNLYEPTPVSLEKVDYFETSCGGAASVDNSATTVVPQNGVAVQGIANQLSTIEKSNPQWSSWSNCDKRTSQRKRFQNCRTMAPTTCANHESQACEPVVKDIIKPTSSVKLVKSGKKLPRLTTRKPKST